MIVKVERCWSFFRLTMPNGKRTFIDYNDSQGDFWCRYYATQALNVLENVYGFTRRSVRFEHLN